jgi:hypothetical protein
VPNFKQIKGPLPRGVRWYLVGLISSNMIFLQFGMKKALEISDFEEKLLLLQSSVVFGQNLLFLNPK